MTVEELYDQYARNAAAHVLHVKLDGKEPNERLMRQVEDAAGIPIQSADDYRRTHMALLQSREVLALDTDWKKDKILLHAIQQIVGGS